MSDENTTQDVTPAQDENNPLQMPGQTGFQKPPEAPTMHTVTCPDCGADLTHSAVGDQVMPTAAQGGSQPVAAMVTHGTPANHHVEAPEGTAQFAGDQAPSKQPRDEEEDDDS